ncbi:MAG: DUF4369 domain-containing protein [Chitinophagaceae bacterium]|nr:DUF4369 domain-containing protein [Chitinophagaceae bacterium]
MKKLLLILLIPALAFTGKPEKKGSLKGKMKFTETVKMVYLSYISGDKRVTDSVILKKGKFEFQTKVAEPTLATLSVRFEPGATDVKPRTDRMQLFIEPGKIKVETSDSLKFAKVTGSAAQQAFEMYKELQVPYDERGKLLNEQYMVFKKDKDQEGMKR